VRPPVDYFRELPQVFAATAVNFNATSMQMNSTVNQRVFDAAACGAFLLTDRTPDMERFFDEGVESVCYGSPEEAYELAACYIGRKREREAIAAAARRRVLAEHTYERRMAQLVDTMRERFA
jgi:spore maturation protein CgeB